MRETTRTEYALVRGGFVIVGPLTHDMWNESITLEEARRRWFPDTVVAARQRTTYAERITPWEERG